MPTVAIASEFLDAFARMPRAQQKKVREFTEKFKANPTSSAINYEKIHAVKDPKVRTVRIDQKYRAIILHPDQGDVYVLVWVDNHDEAMAWAEDRTFEINPATGALQVINTTEVSQAVQPQIEKQKATGLLDNYSDELLRSLAVPAVLLPAVRAIQKASELQALVVHLPAEASEALLYLAEGIPTDEVKALLAVTPQEREVNTVDYEAALAHPDSRRRFVTIQSEQDLTSILDAPLEKWRIFLHPSQDRLVTKKFNGAARVLGGPGTGKTVVAMHCARHLARTLCTQPGDRILFTTYTANLAQNVEQNLANLCGNEKSRIDVVHLHAWAVRFMRSQGIEFRIASNEEIEACWEEAMATADEYEFDPGFLRQEWEQVIQAKGIMTREEYLKVPRTGRGQTLSRPQRGRVWWVFENYRDALERQGRHEWFQVIQEARLHLEEQTPPLPYRTVVVGEAQDFTAEEWRLIRAIVPPGANDLFIVGDAHQRIYGPKIALRNCGISIQGRSSSLRINYRTTEQIRAWAMALLGGAEVDDLDGERDRGRGYRSLLSGSTPEVHHCSSQKEELTFLAQRIEELLENRRPEEICLVARTHKMLRDEYQQILKQLGIPFTLLDKSQEGDGVRLASMHRVKGLEFPVMILAGINSHVMPLRLPATEMDAVTKLEHEERERALLFVAATRARDLLVVSSCGTPSPFIAEWLQWSE